MSPYNSLLRYWHLFFFFFFSLLSSIHCSQSSWTPPKMKQCVTIIQKGEKKKIILLFDSRWMERTTTTKKKLLFISTSISCDIADSVPHFTRFTSLLAQSWSDVKRKKKNSHFVQIKNCKSSFLRGHVTEEKSYTGVVHDDESIRLFGYKSTIKI